MSAARVAFAAELKAKFKRVVQRAVNADQHELLKVANNNGSASEAAWARITADPTYKRLEANLAESRELLECLG